MQLNPHYSSLHFPRKDQRNNKAREIDSRNGCMCKVQFSANCIAVSLLFAVGSKVISSGVVLATFIHTNSTARIETVLAEAIKIRKPLQPTPRQKVIYIILMILLYILNNIKSGIKFITII